MKRISRILIVFFVVMTAAFLPPHFVSAQVERPAQVKKLAVKTTTPTAVALAWTKVSGADGYYLYRIDSTTGKKKLVFKASADQGSYVERWLETGNTYSYQVYSFVKSGGEVYKSKKGSPVVNVELKPKAVERFRRTCYGNRSVFLAWDAARDADYYVLYQCDDGSGEYEKIARTQETNYQVKQLKLNKVYRYKVCACYTINGRKVLSEMSSVVKATGTEIKVSEVHGRYWAAVSKKAVLAKDVNTGRWVRIKAGTRVRLSACNSGTVKAILKGGQTVSTKGSYFTYDNLSITQSPDYYSTEQKEAYINQKGFSSDTQWLLWINQFTSTLNFFKGAKGQWKLVRSCVCVIGRNGHTSPGLFKTIRQSTTNGKPQIFFSWNPLTQHGLSFHCRIDRNIRGAYSGGCVRLGDSDLNYLVKKCPMGTTVLSR